MPNIANKPNNEASLLNGKSRSNNYIFPFYTTIDVPFTQIWTVVLLTELNRENISKMPFYDEVSTTRWNMSKPWCHCFCFWKLCYSKESSVVNTYKAHYSHAIALWSSACAAAPRCPACAAAPAATPPRARCTRPLGFSAPGILTLYSQSAICWGRPSSADGVNHYTSTICPIFT